MRPALAGSVLSDSMESISDFLTIFCPGNVFFTMMDPESIPKRFQFPHFLEMDRALDATQNSAEQLQFVPREDVETRGKVVRQ